MFSIPLADLFVKFTARGADVLGKALDGVSAALDHAAAGANTVGQAIDRGFGRGADKVLSFARAGLQASAAGDVLAFHAARLSREVGAIFVPVMEKAIEIVSLVADWFRNLSGAQQDNILRWTLAAAAAATVARIMPVVIAGISGAIAAVRSLTVAMLTLDITTGGILPALGALAAVLAAVAVGGGIGTKGFDGFLDALRPLLDIAGQIFAKMGEVLAPIAQTMSQMVETLAAGFQAVLPLIMEFLTHVGKAMEILMKGLAPVASMVAQSLAGVWEAFARLLPIIGELVEALASAWVPVARIVNMAIAALLDMLPTLIDMFVALARVVVATVKPALEAIAWILERIARAIAFIAGKKIDLDPKAPSMGGPDKGHRGLAPRTGGFESVDRAYERIAQASARAGLGKGTPERQLEEQEKSNTLLTGIDKKLGTLKPATAR